VAVAVRTILPASSPRITWQFWTMPLLFAVANDLSKKHVVLNPFPSTPFPSFFLMLPSIFSRKSSSLGKEEKGRNGC
jgi:hypothetical protein